MTARPRVAGGSIKVSLAKRTASAGRLPLPSAEVALGGVVRVSLTESRISPAAALTPGIYYCGAFALPIADLYGIGISPPGASTPAAVLESVGGRHDHVS